MPAARKKQTNPRSLANLIPASMRTKEELSAMGKKGVVKTQQINREKKTMRELLEHFTALPQLKKDGTPLCNPVTGEPLSNREAQAVRLCMMAASGNIHAIRLVAELMGDLTSQPVVENNMIIDLSES